MVSRVQQRVIQQGLQDPRAIADGAWPSTSTLLGGACSPPTAHWFLLVGRGRQCVVTSIIRIGIRRTYEGRAGGHAILSVRASTRTVGRVLVDRRALPMGLLRLRGNERNLC